MLSESSTSILINVVLIVAAFLIVVYAKKIDLNDEVERKTKENQESYNNLFEALIESNTQPSIIIDSTGVIQSANSSAIAELTLDEDEKILPRELNYVNAFMESDNIHSQTELKINDNYYLVNMSKFKTDILTGAFITLTNISHIKEAQELQKTFLQNASHELKTPISAIQGICELLLDNRVQDENKLNDFINLISKENERLKSLVSSLTVTSGTQPVYHRFYINDLFKEISMFFSNYHEENCNLEKIEFITENNVLHEVKQDERIITQILINLIENSFKYTDKGSITLTSSMKDGLICFSVKDTGIGINQEDINSIFKRFYRVDKSRSRQTGGSGLGLSIVKDLIESLEASIEVYSKIGEGTEFTLYFKNIE